MYSGVNIHGLPKPGPEQDSQQPDRQTLDSLLTEVGDYIHGDIKGPYNESYAQQRTPPYLPKAFLVSFKNFAEVYASSFAGKPLDKSAEHEIEDFVKKELQPVASNRSIASLPILVLAFAEREKYLSEYYAEFKELTAGSEEADNFTKLELAKTLISKENEGRHNPTERPIQAFQAMAFYGKLKRDPDNIVTTLVENLSTGQLKGEIAAEVIAESMNGGIAANETASEEIKKTIGLLKLISGKDEQPTIEFLTSPSTFEYWPDDLKRLVDQRTALYVTQIADNLAETRDFFISKYITFDAFTPEKFEKALDNLLREMTAPADENVISKTARIGATAVLSARRRRKAQAQVQKEQPKTANAQEQLIPERAAVYVDCNGQVHTEGSDEYEKLLLDYTSEHHEEPSFTGDVRNMITHLTQIDLSNGLPRGIKKLKYPLRRGDAIFSKVYELKPTECTGLPTASKIARKTRIVFAFNNGRVALLGITDRDQFRNLEQKLGAPGRSRRG